MLTNTPLYFAPYQTPFENGFHEGILSAIGNTPLIRLSRLLPEAPFHIYAKMEAFNPGGSIKDRPASMILKRAVESGDVLPGITTIIESSSGNMAIGLAQVAKYYNLRFICVLDPKTASQNIRILQAFGVEIDMVTQPDPETGEFLPARIRRVNHLLDTVPHSFWPNQYQNINNPIAHYSTMDEIANVLNGQVDYLFCSVSTCGTLRGCSEYIHEYELPTKIIAVDAMGSVIFGCRPTKRLLPGHGAATVPDLYYPGLEGTAVHVSDYDCIVGCRQLLNRESILAGASSGAVVSAVQKKQAEIPAEANCVLIFPDNGERYLDTIYSDQWVQEHF